MDRTLYGRKEAAEVLGTTTGTLRWIEKTEKIKLKRFRVGGLTLLMFEAEDQKKIKEYLKKS